MPNKTFFYDKHIEWIKYKYLQHAFNMDIFFILNLSLHVEKWDNNRFHYYGDPTWLTGRQCHLTRPTG